MMIGGNKAPGFAEQAGFMKWKLSLRTVHLVLHRRISTGQIL